MYKYEASLWWNIINWTIFIMTRFSLYTLNTPKVHLSWSSHVVLFHQSILLPFSLAHIYWMDGEREKNVIISTRWTFQSVTREKKIFFLIHALDTAVQCIQFTVCSYLLHIDVCTIVRSSSTRWKKKCVCLCTCSWKECRVIQSATVVFSMFFFRGYLLVMTV